MRAFALLGPREAVVEEVEPPVAGPGQVVVDVERVGLCGTDLEFYTGEMAYLKQGHAGYPIRLGHEWCGRVVYIGLAATPSTIDTRRLVLKDVTAVGVLGGSQGLRAAVEHYSSGAVDPEPLVAATVPLEQAGEVLAGWRPPDAGPGPKIHINPALGR